MPNIMNALINTSTVSKTINKQEKLLDFNMFMLKGFSQAKPNNINIAVNVSPDNNVKHSDALNTPAVDKSKQADGNTIIKQAELIDFNIFMLKSFSQIKPNNINISVNVSPDNNVEQPDALNSPMVDKNNQSNTDVNLIATNEALSFYHLSPVTLAQTKKENVIEANTIKVNASNKDIFNPLMVKRLENTSQLFDNAQENVARAVKTVLWQGMATGYLSQIDSLTNYQLNIPLNNNLPYVNSSKISHTAINHALLNGGISNVPHENSFLVTGNFNRFKNNTINQKKSTDFVSYKAASMVNTDKILPQKMILTFSKEMKKLWIRDYFEGNNLTLEKSEQLFHKLNLFTSQKFDQIAVNGKILWDSSSSNTYSQYMRKNT